MSELKQNLREMQDEEDAIQHLASFAPDSWRDAVGAYLAGRKEKLLRNIERVSDHEVIKRSYKIEALSKLISVVKPLDTEVKLSDTTGKVSRDERLVRLARILTPHGWQEKMLEPLRKAEEKAIAALLERKNIPQNQGFLDELRQLIRFLGRVERDASVAAGRRQKQLRVVNGRR
jgi:hypothetical protein